MSLEGGKSSNSGALPTMGRGLYEGYEMELGDLHDKGLEFVRLWLPRTLVDGFGLASRVTMSQDKNEVATRMEKPFVRHLCINPYVKEHVCGTIGCPLVASIAEALASASGKSVQHVGCNYDSTTQTAVAKHAISQ